MSYLFGSSYFIIGSSPSNWSEISNNAKTAWSQRKIKKHYWNLNNVVHVVYIAPKSILSVGKVSLNECYFPILIEDKMLGYRWFKLHQLEPNISSRFIIEERIILFKLLWTTNPRPNTSPILLWRREEGQVLSLYWSFSSLLIHVKIIETGFT